MSLWFIGTDYSCKLINIFERGNYIILQIYNGWTYAPNLLLAGVKIICSNLAVFARKYTWNNHLEQTGADSRKIRALIPGQGRQQIPGGMA